jgi:DNA-binding NtrC family response regulator
MENVIERTVALADNEIIEPQDLPPNIVENDSLKPSATTHLPEKGVDMPTVIADIERQMISLAMSRASGVKARAASLLGINRTTLVEKMKRLGV